MTWQKAWLRIFLLVSAMAGATACSSDASDDDGGAPRADADATDGGAPAGDAALVDGGRSDAGAPGDAAFTDAAFTDAAFTDANLSDASDASDAGASDAEAVSDAGRDGGTFALLVTATPPGPQNGNSNTWEGVLQFDVASAGAPLVPADGIPAASLADPAGLAYRASSGEVFVGNRHGNNAADGVAGSISRFVYAQATRTFTPSGTILGNGLAGVHQLTFSPTTGELFAANVASGVSRFTFTGTVAVAAGVLGSGPTRGVLVSPDGTRLFVTSAGDDIRQFDLGTGSELAPLAIAAGADLHYFATRDGEVYVAGLGTRKIYRLTLSAADELSVKDAFDASSPVAIAFSPDGLEMYSAGHRDSSLIDRFRFDASLDTWTATVAVPTSSSLGGMLVLP